MTQQNSTKLFTTIALIAVALIVAAAGNPVKTIDTGSVGIVTRFGSLSGRILDPGLNWRVPFIDKVIVFNLRSQKYEAEAQAATKDLQDVNTTIAVVYRINKNDVTKLYTQIGVDENVKDVILQPIIQEAVKQTTAKFTAEELITKREAVKQEVDLQLSDKLQGYNVTLETVAITNFQFSAQFSNAIEAKQVAEQKAKQASYELDQAKKEVEKYKLQAESLNEFTLRKMFIEKWDGKLPTTVNDTFLMKALPEVGR